MENLQALKQEVLDREIERLELLIELRLAEIEEAKEFLQRTKKSEDIKELNDDISTNEEGIERIRRELAELKKLTPEQYIERKVEESLKNTRDNIEYYSKDLEKTQPDENCIDSGVFYVRNEIINLIEEGKIKAPKSPKKQDEFIKELLQTPEYQAKIQKIAQQRFESERESAQENLESSRKYLTIIGPDSEKYLQSLIRISKYDNANLRERICGLDISRIFKRPKYGEMGSFIFRHGDVYEVISQIPQEEYIEKVRPKLIEVIERIFSEYNHDKRALIAKKAGVAVSSLASFFVAGPLTSAVLVGAGEAIANASNSEAGMIAGAGLAIVGAVAGLAGGAFGSYKLAKQYEKLEDKDIELQYEDYIRKAIEQVLTEAGYKKENTSEAAEESSEQPGQN